MNGQLPYRFPVPHPLTSDSVLHVARRLAEAARAGHDLDQATLDGRFYTVPVKAPKGQRGNSRPGPSRTERVDGYRAEILAALEENGPMTVAQVSHKVRLTSGQVGYLLKFLEDRKAVERVADSKPLRYRIRPQANK